MSDYTGQDLRAARDRLGWTRRQLLEALQASFPGEFQTTSDPSKYVGRWETDARKVPDKVRAFLRELEMETVLPGEPGAPTVEGEAPDAAAAAGEDSFPPPPDGSELVGQRPLPGSSAHARVCEELWEMIATACGLAGVVLDSEALKGDRDILLADKEALGRAWGKLAETNDTFRRMLLGMTGGGAWLEVALATGITVGKIQKNHQDVRARQRLEARQEAEREAGAELRDDLPPDGMMYGDQGVVAFPVA